MWPETIASTSAETFWVMLPQTVPSSVKLGDAQSVLGEPSCTSRMTSSAPSALRSAAAALVASTMSVTVTPWMPAGTDERRQVLGDRADEADLTPSISLVHVSARSSRPAGSSTLAAMYSQLARSWIRPTKSS